MKRISIVKDNKVLKEINSNIGTDIHTKNKISRFCCIFKQKRKELPKTNLLREFREKVNSSI